MKKSIVSAVLTLLLTAQTLWAAPAGIPPPPKPPVPVPTPTSPPAPSTKPPPAAGVSPAATPTPETKPLPPPRGRFKFDFNKVQIGELAKTISDMTQRNFIIPEKIKGQTVTIMSPKEITVEEAYQAFLSALEVNDITIVPVGRFLKLIPSGDAAKSPIPTYTDDKTRIAATDNIVTKLIRLQHSDATQISNILNNFKSKIAQVAVYQPTNALIISEWGSNLVRLENLIDKLDTEGTNDQIRLIPIRYATASEIAQRLSELFDVKKGSGGPKPAGVATPPPPGGAQANPEDQLSIQKMIADDRTNQLIVVANDFAYKQLQSIIAKLDVPVGEDTGQVRVIALQNASAEDLSATLQSLATGQTKKKPAAGAGGPPAPAPAQPGGGAASLFEGDVKITADKATNSLLVIASPADFRSVKRMVDQLDIPRRQVFVETAIMEVTIENSMEAGTQWYAPIPPLNALRTPGAVGDALPGVINGPQATNGTGNLLTQALSPITLFQAFGGALAGIAGPTIPVNIPSLVAGGASTTINVPSFALILKALQRSSSANVLSTPYIVATDNEEASIEVGKKQPFARGIGAGAGLSSAASSLGALAGPLAGAAATPGGANPLGALGGLGGLGLGGLGFGTSQVDRIDVSLKLSITPHINDSDRIMLEIDQQLEDIVGQENIAGVNIPVTSKRAVKSKVVLDDQQTVVLGGLIKDNVTETVSGYPFLSDIPIIGWLFKTKSTTKSKSNLLVVITPYIVRTRADYQRIFERKYAEYKAYQEMVYSDSKEFRAYIDFSKKKGPLSLMNRAVKHELEKAENGGKGDAGDIVIVPNEKIPEKMPEGNLVQPGEPERKTTPAPAKTIPPATAPAERKERLEAPSP